MKYICHFNESIISLTSIYKIPTKFKKNELCYNDITFNVFTKDKFSNEQFLEQNDEYIIFMDGILQNSKELINKHLKKSIFDLIQFLFKMNDISLWKELKGDWRIIIYDKSTNKPTFITNHINSKPIYYHKDDEYIIASDSLITINNLLKNLNIPSQFNIEAAYDMLTFGFMLGEKTYLKNVVKMPSGSILSLNKKSELISENYYSLNNYDFINTGKASIINKLDELFSNAINLEYNKDLEYNLNHLVTISGGLDSRVNLLYAHKLGFKNITAYNFSENNHMDETIPKKMCSDFGFDYLFQSLDNGNFIHKNYLLSNILNSGLVLFSGSAHGLNMSLSMNFNRYGLAHTGMIGDLVLGSYLKKTEHYSIDNSVINKNAYSSKLLNIDDISKLSKDYNTKYPNAELFAFNERCINGVFNGYRVAEAFTEFSSPFLDRDFMDFAFKIHPTLRYRQKIYLEWIERKLPDAQKYPWAQITMKPKVRNMQFYYNFWIYFRGLKFILEKKTVGQRKYHSMNPFEYWYRTNDVLKSFFEDTFNSHILHFSFNEKLQSDMKIIFKDGTTQEKAQVLTLIAIYSLLFESS